jgi:hypothetical protein
MPYGSGAYGSVAYGGILGASTLPTVVTQAATGITTSGNATLNGTVNPNNGSTTTYFQWGTTVAYGNVTPTVSAGSGTSAVAESASLTGLAGGTTYHFRIVATNSAGTVYGADFAFFVPLPAPSHGAGAPNPGSAFTYLLYDLYTGKYLGRLPLAGVTFGSQLLTPGTASGTIDIASTAIQNLGPLSITSPARTVLAIDYNGALIWGGIIWPRNYDFDNVTRKLTITATELWSYLQMRKQATDYSAPPYSGITGPVTKMAIWNASSTDALGVYDPLLIAWQVISDALTQVTHGNILGGLGIAANGYTTASGYFTSGTQTPQANYLSQNYPLASLQDVHNITNVLASNGINTGFDYAVDIAYSGGPGSVPVGTVNLSYPRRGRTYASNNLVLNAGQAIKYSPPEDGTQTANTMYEQGFSGSLVVSQNVAALNAGYPVLEGSASRSNIQSANILNVLKQLGVSDLAIRSFPVVTPSVTMDLFAGSVPLGSFITGDNVRLVIPATDGTGSTFDPRFPNGLDIELRIIGYSATVADQGQSTITFNLAAPPVLTATAPII